MRIAYFDCSTGIAGDMTMAALIDAGVDAQAIREAVDSIGLPGVRLETQTVIKGGFRATYVRVEHPKQHAHRHLADVFALIDGAKALTTPQRDIARRIFTAVAEAEAKVHGSTVDKVHFHEVGAIDSIVDIVGAAVGFDLLNADQIVCSPIPPGRGQVAIDHGICTVPAPGTAELLKGIPLADVPIEAELTTPTGAAIVRTMVDRFAALPEMTIEQIGYGAGTRDFPQRANILRLFVGTAAAAMDCDNICLLETNLDDVSGEVVGYAKQRLLNTGALDVYTTPIQMKKDRPGIILTVLCRPADADALESLVFQETGTLGIRRQIVQRSKQARREHVVETVWGPVPGKLGWRAGVRPVFTPEFEACARIAADRGLALREVYRAAESAFEQNQPVIPTEMPADKGIPHSYDHDHDHSHGHSHDHDHDHDHDH